MLQNGLNTPPPVTLRGTPDCWIIKGATLSGRCGGAARGGYWRDFVVCGLERGHWVQKGGTGSDSTWSRQAPVTFLFLVANEKSDFCRDDSSSYIHKRRGKKIKETIWRTRRKISSFLSWRVRLSRKAGLGDFGCWCRNLLIKTYLLGCFSCREERTCWIEVIRACKIWYSLTDIAGHYSLSWEQAIGASLYRYKKIFP